MSASQQLLVAGGAVPKTGFISIPRDLVSNATFYCLNVDSLGNLYLGFNGYSSSGNYYPTIFKMSPKGEILWSRTSISIAHIDVDSNGNIAIGGRALDGNSIYRAGVIKLDASSNLIWAKRVDVNPNFGGPSYINSITNHPDGSTYVTGSYVTSYEYETSTEYREGFLVKLDAAGQILWNRFFPEAFTYKVTPCGSSSFIASNLYAFSIYTADGNIQASTSMTDDSSDTYVRSYAITSDTEGNIYRASVASNFVYIVKYDSSLTKSWMLKGACGSLISDITGISVNSSGDVFVTGGVYASTTTIIKVNAAGSQQYCRSFSRSGVGSSVYGGVSCNLDKVYVAGNIYRFSNSTVIDTPFLLADDLSCSALGTYAVGAFTNLVYKTVALPLILSTYPTKYSGACGLTTNPSSGLTFNFPAENLYPSFTTSPWQLDTVQIP